MRYNKNAQKIIKRGRRLAGFLVLASASFLFLATSTTAFADNPPAGKTCTAGTYNALYQKCLAPPDQSGQCPSGLKKDNGIPPPNNCSALATDSTQSGSVTFTTGYKGKYVCGEGDDAVHISINIGCTGKGNAIIDMSFAFVRFLSIGAGLVVIGSVVLAGVQYSSARDDPKAAGDAIKRLRSALYALFIYIFAAAILNFLIPAGFFK